MDQWRFSTASLSGKSDWKRRSRMIEGVYGGHGRVPWFVRTPYNRKISPAALQKQALPWLEQLIRQNREQEDRSVAARAQRSRNAEGEGSNVATDHHRLRVLLTPRPSSIHRCTVLRWTFDLIIRRPNDLTPTFSVVRTASDVIPGIQTGDLLLRIQLTIFRSHLPPDTLAEMKTRAKLYEYDEDNCKFGPLGRTRMCLALLKS